MAGKGNPKRKRALGERGEEAALTFLSSLGYELLARNYRCPFGEADLVMRDGEVLVFVEVKARQNYLFGLPQEAVDFRKRARLRKIASYFCATKRLGEREVRFDVVAVTFEGATARLEHLKGVF